MKALKRLLLLALALIMCTSLFACSDEPSNDDPSNDDPAIVDPSNPNDPADPADPADPSGLTQVENDYIIDYQVIAGEKLVLNFEGTAPTEVTYGNAGANETEEPFWSVKDNTIEITIEGSMMNANQDKVFKYSTDKNEYTTYLTLNAITNNYFLIDGADDSFKLDIADIASAKFNGTDVASVSGITKDATGLTFTKALLAENLGHNKVEVVAKDKYYTVSVCAVEKEDLRQPITFEDGKLSPFVAVFGNDYAVKESKDFPDTNMKDLYTNANTFYYWGKDQTTKFANKYALVIDHKAGSYEALKVFVSTFYIKGRLDCLSTLVVSDTWNWPGDAGATGYNNFMTSNTTGGENKLGMKMFKSKIDADVSDGYGIVAGKDLASCGFTYFGPYMSNNTAYTRPFFSKEAYDLCFDANGNMLENNITITYRDAKESFTIYLDDICGTISKGGGFMKLCLPVPLAQLG